MGMRADDDENRQFKQFPFFFSCGQKEKEEKKIIMSNQEMHSVKYTLYLQFCHDSTMKTSLELKKKKSSVLSLLLSIETTFFFRVNQGFQFQT